MLLIVLIYLIITFILFLTSLYIGHLIEYILNFIPDNYFINYNYINFLFKDFFIKLTIFNREFNYIRLYFTPKILDILTVLKLILTLFNNYKYLFSYSILVIFLLLLSIWTRASGPRVRLDQLSNYTWTNLLFIIFLIIISLLIIII